VRTSIASAASVVAILAGAIACSDTTAPPRPALQANVVSTSGAATITIHPAVDTIAVGDTVQLSTTVRGADGQELTGHYILWSIDTSGTVTVSYSGAAVGHQPGIAHVSAITQVDSKIIHGSMTLVVRSHLDPASDSPVGPVGSLFEDYSKTSAHWSHIRTMMTDFYYDWTPTERSWAAAHYDFAMSGNGTEWKAANATVGHFPYTLEWSVVIPGQMADGIANSYYHDMQAWYTAHPEYDIEKAFLHVAGATRNEANRAVVYIWDTRRWLINPADPGLRAYTVDRYRRIAATADGAFIDEAGSGDILTRLGNIAEYPSKADYEDPHTSLLRAIKQALGHKVVMLNPGNYASDWDRANILAAGAVHLEGVNDALRGGQQTRWTWIESLLSSGVFVDLVTAYPSTWINARASTYPAGDYASPAQRLKMWELASYYMVVGAKPDSFALQLENSWDQPYSTLWLKAQEADIGHPRAPRSVYTTGTDGSGKSYAVYAREFDRALVLMRIPQGWDTQSFGEETAAKIQLPAGEEWLPLRADGTTTSPVTSVVLRNSEAVILIKKRTITTP
jgi:hypothetical protein